MQLRTRRPATVRALLVVLLLTGLGLWQAWQCHNGTMASPVTRLAAMVASEPLADHHDHEPAGSGLAGLCITVLAAIAGALALITSPVRPIALLRRAARTALTPVHATVRHLTLTELCVSRT